MAKTIGKGSVAKGTRVQIKGEWGCVINDHPISFIGPGVAVTGMAEHLTVLWADGSQETVSRRLVTKVDTEPIKKGEHVLVDYRGLFQRAGLGWQDQEWGEVLNNPTHDPTAFVMVSLDVDVIRNIPWRPECYAQVHNIADREK